MPEYLRRTASDQGSGLDELSTANGPGGISATDAVRELAPECLPSVYMRLRREGIATAVDLAGLDKDDLRELGFTMLERSRLLRWSRDVFGIDDKNMVAYQSTGSAGIAAASELNVEGVMSSLGVDLTDAHMLEQDEAQRRLDEVEQQADFWCSLVRLQPQPVALPNPQTQFCRLRSNSFNEEVEDVRENVLEGLFDLTSERVLHLYTWMQGRSPEGVVTLEALRRGLARCGVPELSDEALTKVVEATGRARRLQGQKNGNLRKGVQLVEFEAMLSRLKLAQLLTGACPLPLDPETLGGRRSLLGSSHVSGQLVVVDYNTQHALASLINKSKLREFFFGHRKRPRNLSEPPLVRWVHMPGLDLNLLLSLTVKYSLHPLGVEDVIDQCPTKIDRYGNHYFAALEQLMLAGPGDGSEPVRVHGRHVAVFCSGPPLFDTILTTTEPDHDEKEDWPGGAMRDAHGVGDAWVERLRERLDAAHSRLRERRADFLMYQILDLSSDELVKVTRAYTSRLSKLEEQPHITASGLVSEWLGEVQLAQQQLSVVTRRVRGLQRLMRRVLEDPDLTAGLTSYVNDVRDHIDEAYDEASYLTEKCRSILEASERMLERHHNFCRQRADDRLNQMVFILTVATAIFAPVQFIAGVYGMNFVYSGGPLDGKPSIPELTWPNGYFYFWMFVFCYLGVSSTCAVLLQRSFKKKRYQDLQKIAGRTTMTHRIGGSASPGAASPGTASPAVASHYTAPPQVTGGLGPQPSLSTSASSGLGSGAGGIGATSTSSALMAPLLMVPTASARV